MARGSGRRLRAGIVGTGLISEFHVAALRALPDVELVGVHDLDERRAGDRAAEWGTTPYASLEALVQAGANVIHVLTPPSAHASVAMDALAHGCHVLIEKPATEDPEDARRIAAAAAAQGLVATVNHSLLYDPQVLRALEQVQRGSIGEVVGVDIFRSQQYPPYEGGPLPPHMRDAGYPWRDVGIHCLYLVERLLGDIADVQARWLSLGGDRNLVFDEWRALISCRRGLAHCQLSWNSLPERSEMIIHGSRGVLRVDLFAMFRSRRTATPLPRAAERVVNAYADSLRPLAEVPVSAWKFVRGEVQPYQAVRNFVTEFYARLAAGRPPPVAVEDAAVLVEWLESVARAAEADHARRLARLSHSRTADVVVTGASGSLGSAIVRRLVAERRSVRAFVRRLPDPLLEGVDYVEGNLGDPRAVDRALDGANVVIHAGAALSGAWPEHQCATVVGTRNVIDSCRRHGVGQLVHVSSMSVVDWAGAAAAGRPVDEATPLEPRPGERGAYTQAKLQAEVDVIAAAAAGAPVVVLRPGVIFGPGMPLIGSGIARRAGKRWLVLGDGLLTPPLVFIDDLVDAVMAAVERKLVSGEVIQVVDPEPLTQAEIIGLADADGRGLVRVPRPALLLLGRLSEVPLGAVGRQSPVAEYRLRSALAPVRCESDRAERLLGWRPRVGVRQGIRRATANGSTG